ncbi:AraC family transcriptional regulator [Azotosporobacter soli]|uniref:helix-turn-helix transcriptional regulator n=1 Tax=Azotosporobacter soli TaxID=3055040 RepID=UPI0031FEE39D
MDNIQCERRRYECTFSTHAHAYAQLIMPLNGRLEIETETKRVLVDEARLFFLPPDCDHTFRAERRNEFLILDIPDALFVKQDLEKLAGGSEYCFDERWQAIRQLLLNEAGRTTRSGAINHLFAYAYSMLLEECLPASVRHIQAHYAEELDLRKLAEIEHYTVGYYSEWFKKNMGVSPLEYIQRVRLNKAKELLANTRLPIIQIAHMTGYSHHSSLSRAFKDVEKMTPVDFRKKN